MASDPVQREMDVLLALGVMHEKQVRESLQRIAKLGTESEARVACAFELIRSACTVTMLSLDEMRSVVMRALAGEFDDVHLGQSFDWTQL